MESLKNRWQNLPLKRFFMLTVLSTAGAVVLASALVIWCCGAFRHYLLPESYRAYLIMERQWENGSMSEEKYLLEYGENPKLLPYGVIKEDGVPVDREVEQTWYSLQKIEESVDSLTPKRKAAYRACGVIMAAAPAVFAFAGIFLCSVYFYRRKLKVPLSLLSGAAESIAHQDLDFVLDYDCGDELGALCSSFEKMRGVLCENNKAMWRMLEERKLLQASVAHDLRNPIAIVGGYAEYLKKGLETGEMNREKILHIVENMDLAAKRLEQYTESVGQLNKSEERVLKKEWLLASQLPASLTEDICLLAENREISLKITGELPQEEILADGILLHRGLENIAGNALRYARKEIGFDFSLEGNYLSIAVTDDGEGFPQEVLRRKERFFLTPGEGGHMGIGLAVSRLLCIKHGGSLKLENSPDGAEVTVKIAVKRREKIGLQIVSEHTET